jgi:O-antigen ligase
MAGGIGMSSLRWDASVDFLRSADQDYQFKDNNLDKQRVGLNRWLILGYSSLALLIFAGVAARGLVALPQFRFWHVLPICLLLWCGCSLAWSVEPSLTIRRTGHLYMAVLGGLGFVAFLNRRELLWTIAFSLTGICAFGIAAELAQGMFTPWRGGYRFCGLGHPNETALFAVCTILACRVLWLLETPNKRSTIVNLRNLIVLIALFNCAILIMTKSRTTLLSVMIALFVIQYVYAQSVNAWLFLFSSSSLALALGLFLAIVPTSVYKSVFGIAAVGRTTDVASLTGRLPLWEEIIRQWQREPMLGYGYGGYWSTRRVEDFAQMFYWEPPNGHSIYIDSLVETGPVGLVLLVSTLLAMMFAGIFQSPRTRETSHLFVVGLSALIAIHGLAESSFFKGCFGPLMFSLGIAMLAARSSTLGTVRRPAAADGPSKSQAARIEAT